MPTATAKTDPITNWPDAPMLKKPALKATATERPVSNKGTVLRTVVESTHPLPNLAFKKRA